MRARPYIPHGLDQGLVPVVGRACTFADGFSLGEHHHPTAQLLYAQQGVMVVTADGGQWVVPTTRGLWVPAGIRHRVRMVGEVQLRTLYIRPDASPGLPRECCVVAVSSLLRELILAATDIDRPYSPESRNGHLMGLLFEEMAASPSLPLRLPQPSDPDLTKLCEALVSMPGDASTLTDWAGRLGIDARTIQRRFSRQTGMTFGQWRQQARLIAALEQLACGAKVIDVAYDLGYNSPSAFATMFKRQLGMPPSDYFR